MPTRLRLLAALLVLWTAAPAQAAQAAAQALALRVDGRYDAATEAAVRRYQAAHGLPATGVADRETTWSLGLVAEGTWRRGDRGAAVRALQRALAHHQKVYGNRRFTGLAPRPHRPNPGGAAALVVAKPAAKPPAQPAVRRPVAAKPVPAPRPTPPEALPTPVPASAPVAASTPEPLPPAAAGGPIVEVAAGTWLTGAAGGGAGPLITASGAFWLGDWGLGAAFAQAPELGLTPAGDVLDAQLRWRGFSPARATEGGSPPRFSPGRATEGGSPPWFSPGRATEGGSPPFFSMWLGLGARMLNGEPLGALALGLDVPLGLDWLRLRASGLGGYGPSGAWTADGQGGLGLELGPVAIDLGFRLLAADALAGMPAMGTAAGPVASAGLKF